MKLFEMSYTSGMGLILGRNIIINGKPYQMDIWSNSYMKNHPNKVNYIYLDEGTAKYNYSKWNSDPVIL